MALRTRLIVANGCSGIVAGVDRHELEQLRRSVVMLSPGQFALSREQALQILGELEDALVEIVRLRDSRPPES
jgi:hypothetical protein